MVTTLTRSDIADELYNTIGLSHNESSEIVRNASGDFITNYL